MLKKAIPVDSPTIAWKVMCRINGRLYPIILNHHADGLELNIVYPSHGGNDPSKGWGAFVELEDAEAFRREFGHQDWGLSMHLVDHLFGTVRKRVGERPSQYNKRFRAAKRAVLVIAEVRLSGTILSGLVYGSRRRGYMGTHMEILACKSHIGDPVPAT